LIRFFRLAAVISVAAVAPMVAANEIKFAKASLGNFELEAVTEVSRDGDHPEIGDIRCEGYSSDFGFLVGREGDIRSLWISFHGLQDEDGERADLTLLGDAVWLYVDGRRYEHRNIGTPTSQFSNYRYPPDPHAAEEIILTWRGYKAVRASEADPFMHMSRIYGELVAAKTLEWGFKSRNWSDVDRREPENALPQGWQTTRYPIQNEHLADAVKWCTAQVASEIAARFVDQTSTPEK
jgi:hypothetical protein